MGLRPSGNQGFLTLCQGLTLKRLAYEAIILGLDFVTPSVSADVSAAMLRLTPQQDEDFVATYVRPVLRVTKKVHSKVLKSLLVPVRDCLN